jgi:ribosomal protein L7/L12
MEARDQVEHQGDACEASLYVVAFLVQAALGAPGWRTRLQAVYASFMRSRQVWLIILAFVIAICAEAIAVPAKRSALLCGVIGLIGMGFWITGRQRRERTALIARLATLSRDDVPADVIGLVAADQKIHAIRRYRELTGAGLREAKAVIDSL